ncbi:hypothetical protein H7849_26380 [Alloacidobacterium dinghuense]|uniref:Uncharacterized protein n=1 Tax=Alloacidobacterium dinghuense TaxID=2763107 RepID=A0A7G8BIT3_9BACT|nr:hypothetical protein [Alloacidobacterium dinghuense]QNI32453.1 hypothetical protein H7849_26380 [Alloacidobacterium dinghuense]
MDKAALVTMDLQKSEKIVRALEGKGFRVAAAIWAHFPEYEDWRFVIASKDLDLLSLSDAYLKVNKALTDAGVSVRETPPIFIMRTTSPFIRALRRVFGKAEDVTGMRLGGQIWGDRFLEDAYAYKIA